MKLIAGKLKERIEKTKEETKRQQAKNELFQTIVTILETETLMKTAETKKFNVPLPGPILEAIGISKEMRESIKDPKKAEEISKKIDEKLSEFEKSVNNMPAEKIAELTKKLKEFMKK
ncbi:MAG: hypothetical protein QW735_01985 [archaeon]